MENDNIRAKYESVESMLDDALEKSHSIRLSGDEENAELKTIVSTLEEINTEFKLEIDKLEAASEWEKYCVAFFGETNAGKSTIIDSLRIIFDEEQRRIEITKQEKDYIYELSKHRDEYMDLLTKLKEINRSLASEKINDTLTSEGKPRMLMEVLKGVGLVLAGVVIGYFISFFGLV